MGGDSSPRLHGQAGKHTKKLIEAVVDCIYDGAPSPAELRLSWQCERFHCLPDSGAYLDQDYELITRMTALSNIYSVVHKWLNLEGKQVHSLSDSERKILRSLKDMGVMF